MILCSVSFDWRSLRVSMSSEPLRNYFAKYELYGCVAPKFNGRQCHKIDQHQHVCTWITIRLFFPPATKKIEQRINIHTLYQSHEMRIINMIFTTISFLLLCRSLFRSLPIIITHLSSMRIFFYAHSSTEKERERNKCEEITSNKFYRLSNSCTSQIRIPHNRSGTTLASKASYWIRKITYSKSHSFFVFFSFFILVWVLTFLVIVSRCW